MAGSPHIWEEDPVNKVEACLARLFVVFGYIDDVDT